MSRFAWIIVGLVAVTLLLPQTVWADDDKDDTPCTTKKEGSTPKQSESPKLPALSCAVTPNGELGEKISGIAAYNYDPSDRNGPQRWGMLDCSSSRYSAFRGCSYCQNSCNGRRQSPINIDKHEGKPIPKSLAPRIILKKKAPVRYKIGPGSFGLECKKSGKCGSVRYMDTKYQTISLHLHYQSEHQLSGRHTPLELHLVHKAGDRLLVLAILFRPGRFNKELQRLLDISKRRCSGKVNLRRIAGSAFSPKNLVNYYGSLTTPPCTESVTWMVSTAPVEAAPSQFVQYTNLTTSEIDNRPLQPLNGRSVYTFA